MMGFNDNNAWLNGAGNLSLGLGGIDDGAGDTSQAYAKRDLYLPISLASLIQVPAANLTYAYSRSAAGLYGLVLTSAGAPTASVGVVVPFPHRYAPAVAAAPHGYKLNGLIIGYSIATAVATSVNGTFATELQANATARAAVSATPLGAVTYQNPIGTVVANLPVAIQATPFVCRIVPATPVFVTTENTQLTAELAIVLTNTAVLTITEVIAQLSMALY